MMIGTAGLDHGMFVRAQAEHAGPLPQRVPNLLDELQALADRQPLEVKGWIYHA